MLTSRITFFGEISSPVTCKMLYQFCISILVPHRVPYGFRLETSTNFRTLNVQSFRLLSRGK